MTCSAFPPLDPNADPYRGVDQCLSVRLRACFPNTVRLFDRCRDGFEARLPLQLALAVARAGCRGRRDDAEYRAPMAPVALRLSVS